MPLLRGIQNDVLRLGAIGASALTPEQWRYLTRSTTTLAVSRGIPYLFVRDVHDLETMIREHTVRGLNTSSLQSDLLSLM
jgi:hypothetical protein